MQLTAKQAIGLLEKRTNIFIDILVDMDGETITIEKKTPASDLTEETLSSLHNEYNTNLITLKTFRKNGTSYKAENDIEVGFSNNGATHRKTNPMNGLFSESENEEDYTQAPQYSTPTVIPSEGNMALFQYIASEKSKRADDLEYRNRKLENESERMKTEILNLKNDLSLKDREHELVIQSKENDSKNSLSGFLEKASTPEFLGAIPGILSALKGTGMGQLPAADLLAGVEDSGHKAALKEMIDYLKTSEEQTGKVYVIVTKTSHNAGLIDKILRFIEKYK